ASLGGQIDLIGSGNHELKSCKDKTISMRNRINLHTIRDDSLLGTLKFVSKTKDSHNKQETHKLQASGSSEGSNFESKVPDESKAKPFDTSKGTGVKPEVPDVLKPNSSDSDNKSWGNSEDETDDINDDVNDDDNDDDNANDDDSGNEDDDGNDAHVSERTDSE
nr:hypothetical protein [Tanacetum cinerariifolium]